MRLPMRARPGASAPRACPRAPTLRFCGRHSGTTARIPLGLYFGATSGAVFGSADGGHSWATVAEHLPPVYSVRVA
jgi:hypothetical protein